jgi:prephenate dehydrogenase
MIERIAILGTGLLGTSVGAGAARGGLSRLDRRLEPRRGRRADCALHGRDRFVAADPIAGARESQVVLLAVPIYATLDWMEKLAGVLGSDHWSPTWAAPRRRSPRRGRALQHAGSRGVSSRPSHGGQGARRRGAGRCRSLSRRGVALYRRSRVAAFAASAALVKGWREWVAAMGAKTSISTPRATMSWSPGSAICRSLWPRR